MSARIAQDLLIRTSCRDLLDDVSRNLTRVCHKDLCADRVSSTSSHKDLYMAFVKIYMHYGLPRLHHETLARS
jgi:hypothetical protein